MVDGATIDGELERREGLRRFPEVKLIDDATLKAATIDAIIRGVPEYFWDVPATASGRYHHPYARNKHGLWIHVKMVATAFERKSESYVRRGVLSDYDADCVRSAILLHDMLKYGHEYEEGDGAADNHDLLAGQWVSAHTDLPPQVIRGIKCHNGPWYEGPTPAYGDEPVADIVHMCDMDGSTSNGTWGLFDPADEITSKYPAIPRANL